MPNSKEQIEKNREFVKQELTRLYKFIEGKNLVFACLIHWEPLRDRLESRVAYFEERYEAALWKDMMNKQYSKLNIPYEIYIS